MKTIRELSAVAGVSRTSIYNLIKKNNIPIFKREGKIYVDESGENLIIAYYSSEQQETLKDIAAAKEEEARDENNLEADFQDERAIENLHLISLLEKELDKNHNTIRGLLKSNQILSQALAAEKVNETARLMIKEKRLNRLNSESIEPRTKVSKENIFRRLFWKK